MPTSRRKLQHNRFREDFLYTRTHVGANPWISGGLRAHFLCSCKTSEPLLRSQTHFLKKPEPLCVFSEPLFFLGATFVVLRATFAVLRATCGDLGVTFGNSEPLFEISESLLASSMQLVAFPCTIVGSRMHFGATL